MNGALAGMSGATHDAPGGMIVATIGAQGARQHNSSARQT
jgi:hypothetical protein